MNLKSLIHRELGEGLTEKELASAVKVPARTIATFWPANSLTTRQSGKGLPGIFVWMRTSCGPVARLTQAASSTSPRLTISPPAG